MKSFLRFLAVAAVVGCAKEAPPPGLFGDEHVFHRAPQVLQYADFGGRARSPKRYILVAGGQDDANFAQEVIDQKKYLMNLGAQESEISCFYAMPFDRAFINDEPQYRSLAADLSKCYPAYPAFVYEEIRGMSQSHNSYIYVTSHGMAPLSWGLENWQLAETDRDIIKGWIRDVPEADQFIVALDALANGHPVSFNDRILLLTQKAEKPENLLFAPRYLKAAMADAAGPVPANNRFLVVQACYSGGFIDTDNPLLKADTVQGMDKMAAMTAAQYDRSSFGCGPGNEKTYFGEAFFDALKAVNVLPQAANWMTLYEDVQRRVTAKEAIYQSKLPDSWSFKPSLPMFYSSEPIPRRVR